MTFDVTTMMAGKNQVALHVAACAQTKVIFPFNRSPQVKAPTARVLTCLILQGFQWAFRKSYPTKITRMVQGGLLAPLGPIHGDFCNKGMRLVQDGAPCHFARTIMALLQANRVNVLLYIAILFS